MNLSFKSKELDQLLKFLEGGEIPAEAPGAAPELGGDPMQQLMELFAQGLQNQDCNLLAQGAQMFLQMAGGGAPEGAAPAEQPVYKRGGRLSKWISK